MHMKMEKLPTHEKIHKWLVGIGLASASFGYGIYALAMGNVTLIGHGNPPIGTFVTFHGIEARFLSAIFIGAGIWLFSAFFLGERKSNALPWVGAIMLTFGMCSLAVILCLPFFQS